MTFTVADFHDLVELLEQNPGWRAELRRLVLTDEILTLPDLVRELAAAQKRTEERLAEFEQYTRHEFSRLDGALAELAEAQKRTEQRVEELAEAQKRTEQRVEELAEAQKRTEIRLTRLEDRIGVTTEEEAADVLRVVMEQKGYHAIEEPFNVRLDGEVDVVLPVQTASGQRLSAVLEAKVRLGRRAVEAWANRMRSPDFRAALKAAGVSGPYLVYTYGMRADVSARQAAEKFGVGLLTSQGEQVAPQGVIEASD